jgi:hypothetical protein
MAADRSGWTGLYLVFVDAVVPALLPAGFLVATGCFLGAGIFEAIFFATGFFGATAFASDFFVADFFEVGFFGADAVGADGFGAGFLAAGGVFLVAGFVALRGVLARAAGVFAGPEVAARQ